jgi:hypothetical protein
MRWPAKDRSIWRAWFAWLPVKIGSQVVWLERVERRFCGDCYEVRLPEPFWTDEDRRQHRELTFPRKVARIVAVEPMEWR